MCPFNHLTGRPLWTLRPLRGSQPFDICLFFSPLWRTSPLIQVSQSNNTRLGETVRLCLAHGVKMSYFNSFAWRVKALTKQRGWYIKYTTQVSFNHNVKENVQQAGSRESVVQPREIFIREQNHCPAPTTKSEPYRVSHGITGSEEDQSP